MVVPIAERVVRGMAYGAIQGAVIGCLDAYLHNRPLVRSASILTLFYAALCGMQEALVLPFSHHAFSKMNLFSNTVAEKIIYVSLKAAFLARAVTHGGITRFTATILVGKDLAQSLSSISLLGFDLLRLSASPPA